VFPDVGHFEHVAVEPGPFHGAAEGGLVHARGAGGHDHAGQVLFLDGLDDAGLSGFRAGVHGIRGEGHFREGQGGFRHDRGIHRAFDVAAAVADENAYSHDLRPLRLCGRPGEGLVDDGPRVDAQLVESQLGLLDVERHAHELGVVGHGHAEARPQGAVDLALAQIEVHLAQRAGHGDHVRADVHGGGQQFARKPRHHVGPGGAVGGAAAFDLEREGDHGRAHGGQDVVHGHGAFAVVEGHELGRPVHDAAVVAGHLEAV